MSRERVNWCAKYIGERKDTVFLTVHLMSRERCTMIQIRIFLHRAVQADKSFTALK